jgi:hypothetical protein
MIMMQAGRSCRRFLHRAAPFTAASFTTTTTRRQQQQVLNPWSQYEMAPLDPIIGLNESFAKDDYPNKVIVGVGAYRDDHGKPYVLPCVRQAEERIVSSQLDMEYSGIVSCNGHTHSSPYSLFFSHLHNHRQEILPLLTCR